jgi:tetratricopeptide (TPR) repeat protein
MSLVEAAFAQALAAHQAGRLADAEVLYRQVLAAEPRHAEALRLLGLVALAAGNAAAAIGLIGESVRLAPRSADGHAQLGLALKAAGRAAEAIAHLETARGLAPADADVLANLAATLRAAGRGGEARRRLRQALALAPAAAEALLTLGNLDHAAATLRALQVRPGYVEAWFNLGNDRARSGDVGGARGAYEAALACNPASLEALTNLGALLLGLDKIEAARLCHRRAATLSPDHAGGLGVQSRGEVVWR